MYYCNLWRWGLLLIMYNKVNMTLFMRFFLLKIGSMRLCKAPMSEDLKVVNCANKSIILELNL